MYFVRPVKESDFVGLAKMEIEIAKISFQEEAITDLEFHTKKIENSFRKDNKGMFVLSDADDHVLGWLWMDSKSNYLTKETYINFRSFYADGSVRGSEYVDMLLEEGIHYAKSIGATNIIGKVHVDNLPMRAIYKNHGFKPTHITMEIDLGESNV